MAKPIRLLVVGASWPLETFLSRLLGGLMDAGMEVHVTCSRRPIGGIADHDNFRWLHAPAWADAIPLRLCRMLLQVARAVLRAPKVAVAEHLRLFQSDLSGGLRPLLIAWNRQIPFVGRTWDVIYFPWNSSAIEYAALLDGIVPSVISCRGSQVFVAPHCPDRAWIVDGLKHTLHHAAAIHCVCKAIRTEALRFHAGRNKTCVITPAVDVALFYPPLSNQSHSNLLRIVMTGNLVWHKGHEYAIQAARHLVDCGIPVQLEIIGEGIERQRLLYTIFDLSLQNYVKLLGRLVPEDVRSRLQHADIFLQSSVTEGISNAALEAMACGLPVVTTDCGGMREAVHDGVEGRVVPVRNSQAMAAALTELWYDPGRRAAMGNAGRSRVEADFSIDKQVVQFLELFHGVCKAKLENA